VLKAIVSQARTGRIGDGKVLVLPCLDESVSWSSGSSQGADQ
jgi:nitrogen regulatory protein PII